MRHIIIIVIDENSLSFLPCSINVCENDFCVNIGIAAKGNREGDDCTYRVSGRVHLYT